MKSIGDQSQKVGLEATSDHFDQAVHRSTHGGVDCLEDVLSVRTAHHSIRKVIQVLVGATGIGGHALEMGLESEAARVWSAT